MYWNLVDQINTMRREMERVFGEGEEISPSRRYAFLPGRAARQYPLMNVTEDKDHVFVEALAPGVNPESWDLTIVGNTLTISGEKPVNGEEVKPESYHRSERSAGKFVRAFDLPVEVNESKVSADYKDGMIFITLPKSEKAKPRQIKVSVA